MGAPLWKRAFDAAEQQAGPALARLLATPAVIEAITLGMAIRKRAAEDTAELIRRGLHQMNLPSGTDVRKVSNQIAALERQIRLLDRRLEELRAAEDRAGRAAGSGR